MVENSKCTFKKAVCIVRGVEGMSKGDLYLAESWERKIKNSSLNTLTRKMIWKLKLFERIRSQKLAVAIQIVSSFFCWLFSGAQQERT